LDIMSNRFADKIVIVTGASSGIGLATSRKFAEREARVIMAAPDKDNLDQQAERIRKDGFEATSWKTDVTKEAECKALIEFAVEKYGSIDILINNAGISMRANFLEVEIAVLKRVMDVNFWGTVYCTKYALPHILKNKGSIVGVSSIAGFHGLPGRTGYSASKFAIHGFLETVRIEHLRNGLHVMVIAPGFTSTNIRKYALTADGSEQGDSPIPEEKLMTPEHVANWILKGIRKKKRNKILTVQGRLIALFQRVIPDVVDNAFYKAMLREPGSPLT